MKKYTFFLCLLLTSSSIFAQSNKQLPESLTMETLSGKKVKLKDYVAEKGKVTVVNFWATWCKPCKEELDNINADYLGDWQDDYDIEFIAVSMDDARTKPKVKGVVDTKGWEYDILCNPDNSAYQALGFNSCPYTLLLDAKGNIVYKHTGYKHGDEEELEKEIAKAKDKSNQKTNDKKVDENEALKARAAAVTKLQESIATDLEKLLAEKIKYYQAFINESEQDDPFNLELNKLIENAKATIQTLKAKTGVVKEAQLDKAVEKKEAPAKN